MAVKKTVYVGIVDGLCKRLSTQEDAIAFLASVEAYCEGFSTIGDLSEEQEQELAQAQKRLAEMRDQLIPMIGQSGWEKLLASDGDGAGEVQKLKAIVGRYTGSADVLRNSYVLDNASVLMGVPEGIPHYISNSEGLRLGNKSKSSGSSGNSASREATQAIKPGQSLFWHYMKNWHQFSGTENGIRIYDLTTREELTNASELPKSVSGAKKIVTGSWGDNRGFVATLPDGCDISAIA